MPKVLPSLAVARHLGVPVALNRDFAYGATTVDHSRSGRAFANEITQVEDACDAPCPDVGEHGLECVQVAMQVGDQGNAVGHQRRGNHFFSTLHTMV